MRASRPLGRRGLLLLPALMIVVATAWLAAPAQAVNRSFFGTISWRDPTAAEFARMGRGGIGTYRTNLYWFSVQPKGPNSWQWLPYDLLVLRAAENGIRVLPTLVGSPRWAARQLRYPPRPRFRDEFRRFAHEVVKRYGRNGTLWATHPGVTPLPVTDVQIWNEVNSPVRWLPKPRVSQYVPVLRAGAWGVRSADKKARVVLAGMYPSPRHNRSIRMTRYLTLLYKRGTKRLFDAVAVHPYNVNPRRSMRAIDAARRVMRRFRDGRSGVWITEVGWATSGDRTAYTVKPRRQASYLRQTFRLAFRTRKRRHILGVIWFAWRDRPPRQWIFRTGLFTRKLRPKPAWVALTRLTGGKAF